MLVCPSFGFRPRFIQRCVYVGVGRVLLSKNDRHGRHGRFESDSFKRRSSLPCDRSVVPIRVNEFFKLCGRQVIGDYFFDQSCLVRVRHSGRNANRWANARFVATGRSSTYSSPGFGTFAGLAPGTAPGIIGDLASNTCWVRMIRVD